MHTRRISEEAEGRKAVFVQAKGHLRLTRSHKKLGREEQGKSFRSHVSNSELLALQLTLLVAYPGFEELWPHKIILFMPVCGGGAVHVPV